MKAKNMTEEQIKKMLEIECEKVKDMRYPESKESREKIAKLHKQLTDMTVIEIVIDPCADVYNKNKAICDANLAKYFADKKEKS